MTSPYKLFKTNKIDLETPAILDYGAFKISIKHAGSDNKSLTNAAQFKLKQFERRDSLSDKGKLDEQALEELNRQKAEVLAELYADHVIVGWEGVTSEDGKTLKYTRENVIKLLLDLPELFTDIVQQSSAAANFKKLEEEKELKNSEKS